MAQEVCLAHYLVSATQTSQMRTLALEIAKNALGWDSPEYQILENLRSKDFFEIATAQREPLSHTIVPRAWRWNFGDQRVHNRRSLESW